MATPNSPKPVTIARIKTAAVQGDVAKAQAELHEANDVLADTVAGTPVSKENVEAALAQNLEVESQLEEATKELRVVTQLLKTAERDAAARSGEDSTMAGRRSGEGVDSVMAHMAASAKRKGILGR